jgi:hypothetical protein
MQIIELARMDSGIFKNIKEKILLFDKELSREEFLVDLTLGKWKKRKQG